MLRNRGARLTDFGATHILAMYGDRTLCGRSAAHALTGDVDPDHDELICKSCREAWRRWAAQLEAWKPGH